VEVPLFLSSMSAKEHSGVTLEYLVETTNTLGIKQPVTISGQRELPYRPWVQQQLDPLKLNAPEVEGVSTIQLLVKSGSGEILHRNFVHIITTGGIDLPGTRVVSVQANGHSESEWSKKSWEVMDGKKVNGTGSGYFEYTFDTGSLDLNGSSEIYFLAEVSAKELFVKDQYEYNDNQDFMKGSRVAPSSNPNSYPMTDETTFPSTINIFVNDQEFGETLLPDDPADHRGVLSWISQLQDNRLREAGSYGYLVKVPLNAAHLGRVVEDGYFKVRLQTTGEGGLAIYGKDFGRYRLDPSLVVIY